MFIGFVPTGCASNKGNVILMKGARVDIFGDQAISLPMHCSVYCVKAAWAGKISNVCQDYVFSSTHVVTL